MPGHRDAAGLRVSALQKEPLLKRHKDNIIFVENPVQNDISSTRIRSLIKEVSPPLENVVRFFATLLFVLLCIVGFLSWKKLTLLRVELCGFVSTQVLNTEISAAGYTQHMKSG